MTRTDATDQAAPELSPAHRDILLELARESVTRAARREQALEPDPSQYPAELGRTKACFVTLRLGGELRGCIGTLTARRALCVEVAHMARAAALEDPRFPPVSTPELDQLSISISVLTDAVPLEFHSEQELLAQLRPGQDGLILRDGAFSGTFLPSVWDKLPEPEQFLAQLKRKAGLPATHWSDTLTVERYGSESFSDE